MSEPSIGHMFLKWQSAQKDKEKIKELERKLEVAREALEFYAHDRTWSPDHFMTGSEVMRSDLDETIWSRFTPGKRARQALKEIEK